MNWPTAASVRGVHWTTKGPGDFGHPDDDQPERRATENEVADAIAQTLNEKIDEPCVETIYHWITLDTDCCARLDEIIRREVAKDTPLRAALLAFIAKEPRVDDLLAERGAYR